MNRALFYRMDPDLQTMPVDLEGAFAGPQASACWVIGGGPSLNTLPCDEIAQSPLPKMGLNLSGTGRLRPTFWTSYDPTVRFHRSIYLDPGVMKFVHRRRAMDLVPETTFKVCECPATYFFDRDAGRGFSRLLDPQATGIIDWLDTLVQAIDILYRLGFRTLYLAGCDMQIQPTAAQIERAHAAGVQPDSWSSLSDFVVRCREQGLAVDDLAALGTVSTYHFDSEKSLDQALRTEAHYFRIAQCLRLSRRCLAYHGLRLVSVTPDSRLNADFPYQPVDEVLQQIRETVGDPRAEPTLGLYGQRMPRWPGRRWPMKDVKPPNWQPPGAVNTTDERSPRVAEGVRPGSASAAGSTPEVVVEDEGWLAAGRSFAEAYVEPREVG
jgi:hypothetical protein